MSESIVEEEIYNWGSLGGNERLIICQTSLSRKEVKIMAGGAMICRSDLYFGWWRVQTSIADTGTAGKPETGF